MGLISSTIGKRMSSADPKTMREIEEQLSIANISWDTYIASGIALIFLHMQDEDFSEQIEAMHEYFETNSPQQQPLKHPVINLRSETKDAVVELQTLLDESFPELLPHTEYMFPSNTKILQLIAYFGRIYPSDFNRYIASFQQEHNDEKIVFTINRFTYGLLEAVSRHKTAGGMTKILPFKAIVLVGLQVLEQHFDEIHASEEIKQSLLDSAAVCKGSNIRVQEDIVTNQKSKSIHLRKRVRQELQAMAIELEITQDQLLDLILGLLATQPDERSRQMEQWYIN